MQIYRKYTSAYLLHIVGVHTHCACQYHCRMECKQMLIPHGNGRTVRVEKKMPRKNVRTSIHAPPVQAVELSGMSEHIPECYRKIIYVR